MTMYPGRLKRSAFFGEEIDVERPIVLSVPVIVSFELAALGLGSEHYDDSYILLPHHVPKVLTSC
jgi:hypothetical protein